MQTYQNLLEISKRVNWQIDDIVGADKRFDFSKPFLPESFARAHALTFLSAKERLTLNHIRAREYLAMFELVEEFVEPFVMDEAGASGHDDPYRAAALKQFAKEEVKHMELFRRVLGEFDREFGVACELIGPVEDIRRAVLSHDRLAVEILVLALEWMSQGHYLESIKDDQALDPQFRSLLKHHWMEECQHARLDGLLLAEMAEGRTRADIEKALIDFFDIVGFFDNGFREQAILDLASFERATARTLSGENAASFVDIQHQALRWTFLGSAVRNKNFLSAIATLGEDVPQRLFEASAVFA